MEISEASYFDRLREFEAAHKEAHPKDDPAETLAKAHRSTISDMLGEIHFMLREMLKRVPEQAVSTLDRSGEADRST